MSGDPKPEYKVGDKVIADKKEGVIVERNLRRIDDAATGEEIVYWDYRVEFPDGSKGLFYEDELN